MSNHNDKWPLWEIFIQSKPGQPHKHVGSLHAPDAQLAIENARDVYTRRNEGTSIWVVEAKNIRHQVLKTKANFLNQQTTKFTAIQLSTPFQMV